MALLTLEAKYITYSHTTQESLWPRHMIKEAVAGMAVKIADGLVPIDATTKVSSN